MEMMFSFCMALKLEMERSPGKTSLRVQKINEAAGEVEVELKHFSLIMVLLRWTLIRGKDILSRFDLLSFDYTLLVLLNKTSPSSAHDMLALLFVS